MSRIELADFNKIREIALRYIQNNGAHLESISNPSEDDFSLIFNIVASPKVIADMNMELSYELADKGLLSSELGVGFDYIEV